MRCLYKLVFSIVGLLALLIGGFLLYTVFIDTPEERIDTLGAALQNETLTTDTEVQVVSDGGRTGDRTATEVGQGGDSSSYDLRVVEFEWPEELRTGEASAIRLTLKKLPDGGLEVSVPEIAENTIVATPISVDDCYDSYDASVSAHLVAPELTVDELTNATRTLTRETQDLTWRWNVTGDQEKRVIMTLLLDITWTQEPGTEARLQCESKTNYNIWGQSVQVEIVKVLGLISIREASVVGTALAVIGFIGQFPVATEIFGILFERQLESRADQRRQRKAQRRRK